MKLANPRLAPIVGLAALLVAPHASAFCRTTTCDPSNPEDRCEIDADGCVSTGLPLAWASSCVTVGVQKDGSTNNGLSYDEIAPVVEKAFQAWMDADCANGKPSIGVNLIGAVDCRVSEYNPAAANANIVLFREDEWPYAAAANAIALTTTRFSKKTGELWDADIEINGVTERVSIGDPILADDLLSVLTHEAGHFLGLSHSDDPLATMRPIYNPARDGGDLRSLEPDDVRGICAMYPPERAPGTSSCANRHGFSGDCGADQPPSESKGCSVSAAGASKGELGSVLVCFLVVHLQRVRRRARAQLRTATS